MQLTRDHQCFPGALSKRECNKFLSHANNAGFKSATIISKTSMRESNLDSRDSDVVWIDEPWAIDVAWKYMKMANNKCQWCFDVNGAEPMQITRYKKDQFYTWHADGTSDTPAAYSSKQTGNNSRLVGNVRKLSMSIILNDGYEGGDFQIARIHAGEIQIITPPEQILGTVIVFPSFLQHRVTPVTKGVRHSLVTWFLGPPFK